MHNKKIENFARETRKELINAIKQKAFQYGINEKEIKETTLNSENEIEVNGLVLDPKINKQRNQLINHIDLKNHRQSFNQLIEEVAYTWFNRITALRFMEINDYLDHGIRVLSTTEVGKKTPDIVENALSMGLEIDKEVYYDLVDHASDNELYKYVLLKQCNRLSNKLDFLFESTNDYTELLLPDDLLDKGSFIKKLVKEIHEEDFKDVEIIGWLYQYYISELKDKNFEKTIYAKDDIPSVTQLFTPHWIVQYMVQNSLGKLWLESHEEERQKKLKENWVYYLEPAKQSEEVKAKLKEIINTDLKPEEITFLDPACGSGHILVYAFDILYEIYENNGYHPRVIVENILEKNLYGLDIDKRATQLAKFALLMRARQKNRSILDKDIHLNIASIEESNQIEDRTINYCTEGLTEIPRKQVLNLINKFKDANEYGSILKVDQFDYETINSHLESLLYNTELTTFNLEHKGEIKEKIKPLIEQGRIMSKLYDIVVTNPPYITSKKFPQKLSKYIKKEFKSFKSDIYAVFIKKGYDFLKKNGYLSMITQQSWIYYNNYSKLRKFMLKNVTLDTVLHLGPNAFEGVKGEVVQSAVFSSHKIDLIKNRPIIFDLRENSYYEKSKDLIKKSKKCDYYNDLTQKDYLEFPECSILYNLDSFFKKKIIDGRKIEDDYIVKRGASVKKVSKTFKNWFELEKNLIDINGRDERKKWVFCNRNSQKNKWFGNIYKVMLRDQTVNMSNNSLFFKEAITFPDGRFGNSTFTAKMNYNIKSAFESNVNFIISDSKNSLLYLLGYLNTELIEGILSQIIVGQHFSPTYIKRLPIIYRSEEEMVTYVTEILSLLHSNNKYKENNIEFKKNEILFLKESLDSNLLEEIVKYRKNDMIHLNKKIIQLENKINNFFNSCTSNDYGINIENELTKLNKRMSDYNKKLIEDFINYFIGICFNRYSLDDYCFYESINKNHIKDLVNKNFLSISKSKYSKNDILTLFRNYIKIIFGKRNVDQNLDYIASVLSGNGRDAETIIKNYFMSNKFYKFHCNLFSDHNSKSKTPIYWQISNNQNKSIFKALIYYHDYDKKTLSIIRMDYIKPFQKSLMEEKEHLEQMIIEADSKSDESTYKARINDINENLHNLIEFDEKLGHLADQQISIDLDDGVKENYKMFEDILDKIR